MLLTGSHSGRTKVVPGQEECYVPFFIQQWPNRPPKSFSSTVVFVCSRNNLHMPSKRRTFTLKCVLLQLFPLLGVTVWCTEFKEGAGEERRQSWRLSCGESCWFDQLLLFPLMNILYFREPVSPSSCTSVTCPSPRHSNASSWCTPSFARPGCRAPLSW